MKRSKTSLTPENQWERTAAYHIYMNRFRKDSQIVGRYAAVFIFHGTHHLVQDGDVLIFTSGNGMRERFGMTGISSTGARLSDCYLPLRRGSHLVELPGDFIGMQWNDPAIGRYVADLRASCRSRVSANSPATSYSKISPGIDTSEITCFGLYKSGRLAGNTRTHDFRHYLRFYPDGSVAATHDYEGWSISFEPGAISFSQNESCAKGTVYVVGTRLTFELLHTIGWDSRDTQWIRTRYEGQFKNGRLWLRLTDSNCSPGVVELSKEKLPGPLVPYRFHSFDQYSSRS